MLNQPARIPNKGEAACMREEKKHELNLGVGRKKGHFDSAFGRVIPDDCMSIGSEKSQYFLLNSPELWAAVPQLSNGP